MQKLADSILRKEASEYERQKVMSLSLRVIGNLVQAVLRLEDSQKELQMIVDFVLECFGGDVVKLKDADEVLTTCNKLLNDALIAGRKDPNAKAASDRKVQAYVSKVNVQLKGHDLNAVKYKLEREVEALYKGKHITSTFNEDIGIEKNCTNCCLFMFSENKSISEKLKLQTQSNLALMSDNDKKQETITFLRTENQELIDKNTKLKEEMEKQKEEMERLKRRNELLRSDVGRA